MSLILWHSARGADFVTLYSYGGYSSTGWGDGVRNIVFHSPSPSVGPETWIRMEDGETHARIIMDSSYN